MTYSKPHLTFEEQVEKLIDRGLECSDKPAAIQLLTAVGYYRVTGYVYPFRKEIPEDQRDPAQPFRYRLEAIKDGVTFDHVRGIWNFDRKLRNRCLEAVEIIEIGLRTQVAYTLGMHDKFGHLTRSSLDEGECKLSSGREDGSDRFEAWIADHEKLRRRALQSEDYVKHNTNIYGEKLPVWIAVEFLDFGALSQLFGLLRKTDQTAIAQHLGIKGGMLVRRWLRDINYVRNLCAHHSRLWNRVPTYKPGKFTRYQVPEILKHAAEHNVRDKVYVHLAVMAYLVVRIDPTSNWPRSLATVVNKFPDIPYLTPEQNMGFPNGWKDLELWRTGKG